MRPQLRGQSKQRMTKKTNESQKLAQIIANGMLEKKAEEVIILDLRKLESAMTDFFVICHGSSDKQVDAIADSIETETRKVLKERPWHVEGKETSEWILLDYINVVAHVFVKDKREFFGLELLWGDAKITKVEQEISIAVD